jgi:hypothetical protein
MVEHSSHHSKVEGFSLATAVGEGENGKKMKKCNYLQCDKNKEGAAPLGIMTLSITKRDSKQSITALSITALSIMNSIVFLSVCCAIVDFILLC